MCLSLAGTGCGDQGQDRVQRHFLQGVGEGRHQSWGGPGLPPGTREAAFGGGGGGRVPPAAALRVEGPEPGRGAHRAWSRSSTRASWRSRTGAGTCTGRPSCTAPAASACTPPPSPRGRAGAGRASLATPEPRAGDSVARRPGPLASREGLPPGLRPPLPALCPCTSTLVETRPGARGHTDHSCCLDRQTAGPTTAPLPRLSSVPGCPRPSQTPGSVPSACPPGIAVSGDTPGPTFLSRTGAVHLIACEGDWGASF